ncbi:MAG: DUF551 domain-containing protein [Bacteroidales bacterium]|nr:DUF551 domain-containing protein [Clostridium sp.]MCM1204695.1 DUF551 domain-containing protein [Bacteroidales bacterium]
MEWILCSEREPSVEEIRKNNVFICSNGINTYIRSYSFRLHGFVIETRGRESKDRGVIAWMPLPKPYKVEGNDL